MTFELWMKSTDPDTGEESEKAIAKIECDLGVKNMIVYSLTINDPDPNRTYFAIEK
jgi:hypothetical protein